MSETTARRTDEEIAALKRDWEADPMWDLSDIPGFEAHREELAAHQATKEAAWKAEADRRLADFAASIGTDNLRLAEYVRSLVRRVTRLEEMLDGRDALPYPVLTRPP